MRDYGKVQSAFWTSTDTQDLSDTGRILALYLLTGPHSNQIGCFRLPDGYAAEDLKWGMERVSEGFRELSAKGFATRDDVSKWVVVHKFCKWNEIENPNQAKSAARLFDLVPSNSPVKPVLAKALREFSPRFPADVLDAFETLLEGLCKPSRNQEQEQEKEKEEPPHTPPPPVGGVGADVDADESDGKVKPLPAGKSKRERKARTTLKTFVERCKADGIKPVTSYAGLMEYIEKIQLPADFLALAWDVFTREHLPGGANEHRLRADWQRHFYNYVTKGYYRLWMRKADGSYDLTTVGREQKEFNRLKEAA